MPKQTKKSKSTTKSKRATSKATTRSKAADTWVVTSSGERPLHDIASDLKAKGVTIEAVLDEIGCITIQGGKGTEGTARKVKGVADVSPNAPIDIGPPNSSDTW